MSHAATAGLSVEVEPTDLHVVADPGAVVRVVSNLLANAGHHARAGDVVIEARPRGRWVEVVVRDDGEGWGDVDAADAEQASTAHHGGLGLGLTSVRSHVEDWQGEVQLQESPGGGATVQFTLPRAGHRTRGTTDGVAEQTGWTIADDGVFLRGVQQRAR
jgi:two-component system sensor histidine kinase KdpD